MRGRRSRGGARAPPGARPTSMGSRSSPEATVEEELQVRNVQEETEEETRARKHHGEDGQGSSSSSSFVVPESRSRFWPAAREAGENSAAPTSPSRFWGGAPQGGKNSRSPSWSAGRSSLERSTVPDVAGASGSVPVVAARTDRMGEEAKSELQRAAGKIEGVTAFTKMELPKPPREFATNRPHRDADPLHGGAMDNPVMLASGCSIHQSYEQTLPSEEQIQDILKKFSGHSELQKEAIHLPQAAKRVLGVTRNSSAPRILRQEQACSDVASTSGSVPSANQSYEQWFNSHKNRCHPNEVAVKWSSEDDDGIPYPLYAEFCEDNSSLSPKREWDDVRVVRRLRGLRWQERVAARTHFREVRDSWRVAGRKPTSLFMSAMDKVRDERPKEYSGGCTIPEYLICPLSHELMVDPVTIATGKTFERRFLKGWFEKNGHICPLTNEMVSSTIIRNERIRGYLEEWDEVLKEEKVTSHSSRRTRQ